MANAVSSRSKLIELIDKPLGFYVLALIIVETFLVAIGATGHFLAPHNFYVVVLGVAMFVYVTALVTALTWCKVENLTFNQAAHLKNQKKSPYGSKAKPVPDLDNLPRTAG